MHDWPFGGIRKKLGLIRVRFPTGRIAQQRNRCEQRTKDAGAKADEETAPAVGLACTKFFLPMLARAADQGSSTSILERDLNGLK